MIRWAYRIAVLAFLILVGTKFDRHSGFTSLIRFGETWQDRRVHSLQNLPISTVACSNGYDGQFYAQIAVDPLLRNKEDLLRAIDAPAYRARRILVPATAALLGVARPWRTLQVYALLNVICWFALAWLLRASFVSEGWRGFARWMGCVFSMGVMDSVRQSLVDLPALLFLALAIRAHLHSEHSTKTTLWLALGNLAKEMTAISTLALNLPGLFEPRSRRFAFWGIVFAALPLGIWSLYVEQRFNTGTSTAGLGNFTWPLTDLFVQAKLCLNELFHGNIDARYSFGLLGIIGMVVQAAVLWRNCDLNSPWWRIGAAYSLLLPFLSLWVWGGYWAACRAVLPLTIAFNVLLPANRSFWSWWMIGNATVLHAVWRFL